MLVHQRVVFVWHYESNRRPCPSSMPTVSHSYDSRGHQEAHRQRMLPPVPNDGYPLRSAAQNLAAMVDLGQQENIRQNTSPINGGFSSPTTPKGKRWIIFLGPLAPHFWTIPTWEADFGGKNQRRNLTERSRPTLLFLKNGQYTLRLAVA